MGVRYIEVLFNAVFYNWDKECHSLSQSVWVRLSFIIFVPFYDWWYTQDEGCSSLNNAYFSPSHQIDIARNRSHSHFFMLGCNIPLVPVSRKDRRSDSCKLRLSAQDGCFLRRSHRHHSVKYSSVHLSPEKSSKNILLLQSTQSQSTWICFSYLQHYKEMAWLYMFPLRYSLFVTKGCIQNRLYQ